MQISILGCGWLGLPLAKALISGGHSIKGSTTTEDKLQLLSKAGINPFLVTLSASGPSERTEALLKGSDLLLIDIPPKLRGDNSESYTDKIQELIPQIEKAQIKKVLFVSSTSVYADDNSEVTEETVPNPDTESGKQILQAEKILSENKHFKTTILRCGGLIGEDRHPVKHLAGRENLPNPDAPVNLIHQDDCIGIIKAIISKGAWGEIFNAVAPNHPTREEYYTKKAKESGLALPKFNHQHTSIGKKITAKKLLGALSYNKFRDN